MLFSVIGYFFCDPILAWLAKSVGKFVFTAPTEAFFVRLNLALSMGIVFSFPVFLYHVWRFVERALESRIRFFLALVLPFSYLLFVTGLALGLVWVAPLATRFLLSFGSPSLRPFLSIQSYLSFLFWMLMGFGLLFQLPVVVLVLVATGVMNSRTLAGYRKHILAGLFIVSALLSPGPDIFSQIIMAIPAYLLFEISLFISKWIERK